MAFRKATAALMATCIALGSTAASAQTAGEALRTPASIAEAEFAGGASIGWIIGVIVAAAVAFVVIDDDDDDDDIDEPVSP